MAILNFDSTKVEAGEFEPIPAGEYRAMIVSSEMKDTAAGRGDKRLDLRFEIVDGKHKGRKLFENLNLIRVGKTEKDATTTKIAQQRLKMICEAVGKTHIKDSAELHNKPMLVDVVIEAGSGTYKDRNVIKKFAPLGPVAPHEPPQPAQEEPAGVMPWEV
jgi:Protein of unknown function (DUF669).